MLPHYEQNTMKKFLNVRNLRARKKACCLKLSQKSLILFSPFQFQQQNQVKSQKFEK